MASRVDEFEGKQISKRTRHWDGGRPAAVSAKRKLPLNPTASHRKLVREVHSRASFPYLSPRVEPENQAVVARLRSAGGLSDSVVVATLLVSVGGLSVVRLREYRSVSRSQSSSRAY